MPALPRPPYLIPAGEIQIEQLVVNSRFIATALPVSSVEDVKAALSRIRAAMPDANHHVYAYRIGFGSSVIEGMSDDGEPTGTAGPPALAAVRGSDLGDVMVVITRYFGGTKLGTGGLVRAYTDAAQQALAAVPRILKIRRAQIGIDLAYTYYERLKRLIAAHEGVIDDESFGEQVSVIVTLPESALESFTNSLTDLTAGQAAVVRFDTE
jgi:uncharacterized YigZ family protein